MDRTIWNDGVEVTQAQLVHEHESVAENILQRWVDGHSMGVASGLTVTVNGANALLVDIAAGHGYAPGGDWVELTSPLTGIGLTSYVLGTVNYICLVYTEVASRPEAHEVDGTVRNTQAARSVRARVMTLEELNALLPTSSDLSLDARDRTLVVASVVAQGPGVLLLPNVITNALMPSRVLSIVQPSVMTGVEFLSLSEGTPTTAERVAAGDASTTVARASVQMTFSGGTTVSLAYRAPGETPYASFGTAQNVTAGGTFTLPSVGGARSAVVRVFSAALPKPDASIGTITEDVDVTEVYAQPIALTGARDEQHRHADGSVIPSETNPHGLKVSDLSAVQQVLSTFFTGTGLGATRGQTMTPHLFTSQSANPSSGTRRLTLVWEMETRASPRQCVRLYLVGVNGPPAEWGLYFTVNARWIDAATFIEPELWVKDDNTQPASRLSLLNSKIEYVGRSNSGVSAFSVPDAWFDTLATNGWDHPILQGETFYGAGAGVVNFLKRVQLGTLLLSNSTEALTPRLQAAQVSTTTICSHTLLFEFNLTGPQFIRVYLDNFGALVFTVNAYVTAPIVTGSSNATWTYDDSTVRASKFYFSNFQCSFQVKNAGGTTWADNAWDAPVWLSSGNGQYHKTYGHIEVDNYATVAGYITSGDYIEAADYIKAFGQMHAGEGITDPHYPRYVARIGTTNQRFLVHESNTSISGGFRYRVYVGPVGVNFYREETFNCYWNGAQWVADNPVGGSAVVYRFTENGLIVYKKTGPGASWADSAWDSADRASGVVRLDAGVPTVLGAQNVASAAYSGLNVVVNLTVPMRNATAYPITVTPNSYILALGGTVSADVNSASQFEITAINVYAGSLTAIDLSTVGSSGYLFFSVQST